MESIQSDISSAPLTILNHFFPRRLSQWSNCEHYFFHFASNANNLIINIIIIIIYSQYKIQVVI